jgi:hypothetical protein
MATYLQGVTDYIPQIQPFQPNINLMANVLQTKQSKYDSNHKAISNVYSQMVYADLSREDNQERRDELVKAIDFNLKKVAGMDLSLSQNVRQAQQLFTPFYEDKYLMKDMAFTKNYMSQRGRADGLKNSTDEKQRAQYWDTGVKAMDYKVQEFKEAELGDTLGFGNVSYTGYVNTVEKALDLAKKAGLSIETIDFSPDGKWIIKNTNGEKLKEPLSKLFEATLAKDPAVQAVYQTQAYVNRKDYASVNASMFGGDAKQAEIKYLQEQIENQSIKMKQRYDNYRERSQVYAKQIETIEKNIAAGKAEPGSSKFLSELKSNKQIADVALQRLEESKEQLEGSESSTLNTNNGFRNPYGDIETLRRKVDGAVANDLLYGDLNQAAETFAYRNYKQDIQANPYKVMEIKHQNALSLERTRQTNRERLLTAKINAEKEKEFNKYYLDNGLATYDPRTGKLVFNEEYFKSQAVVDPSGTATSDLSMQDQIENYNNTAYEFVSQTAKDIGSSLETMLNENNMTPEDFKNITGYDRKEYFDIVNDKDRAIEVFTSDKIKTLVENFQSYYEGEGKQYGLDLDVNKFNQYNAYVKSYDRISKEHTQWYDKMHKEAETIFSKDDILGSFNIAEEYKDKVKTIYLEMLGKARQTSTDKGILDTMYGVPLNQNSQLVKDFHNRLVQEGIVLPALGSVASKEYEVRTGNKHRRATGSQIDLDYMRIENEVAQRYRNPETGEFFKSANDYKKYYNKNYSVSLGYNNYAHKMLNNLDNSYNDKLKKMSQNNVHPLLSAYGDFSTSAVFTPSGAQIHVNKDSKANHEGLVVWNQFYTHDFMNKDIDGVNIQLSVEGMTQSGIERFKEQDTNKETTRLIQSLIQHMHTSDKTGKFTMSFFDVAANQLSKEALTIKPSIELINDWKKTLKEKEASLLDEEKIVSLFENVNRYGITIIADDNTFQNNLAATARTSLIERAVNASDKPFVLTDFKDSNNQISFSPSAQGNRMYDVNLTLSLVDFEEPDNVQKRDSVTSNLLVSEGLEYPHEAGLMLFSLTNDLNKAAANKNTQAYLDILSKIEDLREQLRNTYGR